LSTRFVEAGWLTSFAAGRMGRATKSPPQFGQRPPRRPSAQSRQKVHSKVQITASVAAGGKSLSQHSQFGRSSSICHLVSLRSPGRTGIPRPAIPHLVSVMPATSEREPCMRAPNIDEIAPRRYMPRHDRNACHSTASPPPDTGRGDARLDHARLIVTCGRGFRGAFPSRNSARCPVPA
jgi:hypothetical protein